MNETTDEVRLVINLVCVALGEPTTNIHTLSDKNHDNFFKEPNKHVKVLWIRASKDPVNLFWRAVKYGCFTDVAYVIFTDIDKSQPAWRDLKEYEGCMFGSIYLLVYDAETNVGVKPSQRGLFNKEG